MKPPVWLLDVDGVINAAARRPPVDIWPANDWLATKAMRWPILTARPVVEFLCIAHETGMAEVRWHTTWQHNARILAEAVGLPPFPVQHAPEFHGEFLDPAWWKVAAAHRALDEGRGLVWTDDDITTELSAVERAPFDTAGALLVAPATHQGLSHADLEQIDVYLTKAAAECPR